MTSNEATEKVDNMTRAQIFEFLELNDSEALDYCPIALRQMAIDELIAEF